MADTTHNFQVRTTVKDLASRALKSLGKTGEGAGKSIAAGFVKAQIALAAMKMAIRGVTNLVRSLTTDFGETADRTAKLARRLGVGIEALSEYGNIAEFAGSNLDDVANAVRFVQRSLAEAERGTKTYTDAFDKLGFTSRDITNLMRGDGVEAFEKVGLAISNLRSHADKTNASMILMGRSGTTMIPVFENGAEAIRKQREELRMYGVTLTEAQGAAAEAFQDARKRLNDSITGIRNAIAMQFLPTLTNALNRVAEFMAKNRDVIVEAVKQFIAFIGESIINALETVSIQIAKLVDAVDSLSVGGLLKYGIQHGGAIGFAADALGIGAKEQIKENEKAVRDFWETARDGMRKAIEFSRQFNAEQRKSILPTTPTAPGDQAEERTQREMVVSAVRGFWARFQHGTDQVGGIAEAVRKIREQLKPEALGMTTVTMLTQAWTGFFDAITFGAQKAEDAFKNMALSMLRQVAQMANTALIGEIFGALVGGGKSSSGGQNALAGITGRNSSAARSTIRDIATSGLVP